MTVGWPARGDGDSVLVAARLAFLLHGWLVGTCAPTNQLENWVLTYWENSDTMDDMERWKEETVLTLVEVVRVLRLSRNTIIRLVRDGKLNGKKVGKQWRISTSSVVNLLDQLEKSHG